MTDLDSSSNIFSKIYEKYWKTNLFHTLTKPFRSSELTIENHMRMIEEWRVKHDNDNIVGAILMY